MTEFPRSEVPSQDVTDIDEFRSTHHPDAEPPDLSPEGGEASDSMFAARLLDSWAQLPEESSVYQHILFDATDDERVAHLINDQSLIEKGATLHFAGENFATSIKAYDLSDQQVEALEIMYRLHFVYQRAERVQPVRHPMVTVLFDRIIEETRREPNR